MNRNVMNEMLPIARLLLAAVFIGAGCGKLFNVSDLRKSLVGFGAPSFLLGALVFSLPLVELACGVALMFVRTAWWAAGGALLLLLLFSAAIAVNLARGRTPDCQCFGQLHSAPVGWSTLVRNLGLAGMAVFVFWEGQLDATARMTKAFGRLGSSESPMIGLLAAVLGLAALQLLALVYVLRQNGRLLLRIETLEGKSGDAMPAAGLALNSIAPTFTVADLDGKTVTLDSLRERGQPLLLFFTEPGCGACDALLPELGEWQRDYGDRLSIVPISRGDAHQSRAKVNKHKLRNVLLQSDREVTQAYKVEATPSAVLVTDGRIGSPVAAGADAIRSLVMSATAPPALKQGDIVPPLRLSDLRGKSIDLTRQGRRTLLLFWNPACGFCQAMLEDAKAWERNRPADAPELLVISGGSLESNRAQGFRSRVLLDPHFTAGNAFGAGGTPSAVIVDEGGRVASDVAVGAPAVLFLAGAMPAGKSLVS